MLELATYLLENEPEMCDLIRAEYRSATNEIEKADAVGRAYDRVNEYVIDNACQFAFNVAYGES